MGPYARSVGGSFRILRLFGIDINVHLSWLAIFGLVLFDLWSDIYPSQYPFWSDQKTLLVSMVTALLFFGSILAHELSHSLVARRFRMRVSSITLFLLGGVANLRQEPPTAKAEFFMAAAGPAMSVLIGLTGIGLAALIDGAGLHPLQTVSAVAGYLGVINLALAGFNLIPGFPLDGGRVLRSAIWAIRRDRPAATRIAARGGQLVSGLFVLWAAVRFVEGRDGLWWWPVLIAYFLFTAASQSLAQERAGTLIGGVRVGALMRTSFAAAEPDASVAAVLRDVMLPQDLRAVPVVHGPSFLGLLTTDRIRTLEHERWGTTRVADAMVPAADLDAVAPEDDLAAVLERFGGAAVLPVQSAGRLVGLLDRDVVASHLRTRELFSRER
jgi:Zn-dependent protease